MAAIRAAGIDWVRLPTTAAAKAADRNWPSIETLTTPDRSHKHPAEGTEDQRGGQRQRAGELVADREGQVATRRRPGQKPDHDGQPGDGAGQEPAIDRASGRTSSRPPPRGRATRRPALWRSRAP